MTRFLTSRLIQAALVLCVVITATFLLVRLAPGSPFASERKLDPAVEAQLREQFGLGGNLMEQFFRYGSNLIQGNLGNSLKYTHRTVLEIIQQTLPVSLLIGTIAFILAIVIGVSLGSYAAVHHGKTKDRVAMLIALLGICLPTFVIAPALALIFALIYPLLPVAGWGTPAHLILPVICLAAPYAAYCARLMRTSMLEVLNQDFIRTARAKGLQERSVIMLHALKVAILPLVSFAGPLAAHMLTGSLVIEEIFGIPGMGTFFINSVLNRDVFVVGGVVIIYSTLLVLFNIVVDFLYVVLDKRIKLS
jgi:oligopeptide transport system permease protein